MAQTGEQASEAMRRDLAARVTAIDARVGFVRAGDLAAALADVRRLARLHRIGPALAVIHAIDGALARGEGGPLIHGWLAILREAIGCGIDDAHACETYVAACSVRLAG